MGLGGGWTDKAQVQLFSSHLLFSFLGSCITLPVYTTEEPREEGEEENMIEEE